MALDPTLTLLDVAGTSYDYAKVDYNLPGTKRIDTSLASPDRGELLIRSQSVGKGINKADRHTVSLTRYTSDAIGNLIQGSVSFSLVFPISTSFTADMMKDLVKEVIDFLVTTSPVVISGDIVDSLLRGES